MQSFSVIFTILGLIDFQKLLNKDSGNQKC